MKKRVVIEDLLASRGRCEPDTDQIMKRTFEMQTRNRVGYAGECSVTKGKLVLFEQLEWYRGIFKLSSLYIEAGVFCI
ncbi:hypothetical protein BAVI_13569 [Neobacillus vireti LMG 21834]|uniref:Uncharacterized protein n=1 Tax=Neobacillus vireti LMG 21834 TaxID=1131730 RepID=A0AB94IM99_9BACI|nr:hypothetical protein BAVI_13569 [Neobacillus vireti LMG 21834]KLT20064.1 hypothetical protein AA980_00065 [Neobacillus vireti]